MRDGWRYAWTPASHAAVTGGVVVAVAGSLSAVVFTGLWDEFFGPEPAPKAASCPGKGCEGKNPQKIGGCTADARTYPKAGKNPATLHLRYSKRCGAIWARVTTAEVGDSISVSVEGGSAQSAVVETFHDQFTPMTVVARSFKVKACVEPTHATNRKGTWDRYCMKASDKSPWSKPG
ncbi:DUF2690 domain-containing protein [Actinomycetota bacterium Odt1-20B]